VKTGVSLELKLLPASEIPALAVTPKFFPKRLFLIVNDPDAALSAAVVAVLLMTVILVAAKEPLLNMAAPSDGCAG
jgi:hypothetical protein